MASMLLDYLVTDAFVRSNGRISFPTEYMEGYAYLQNNMYGVQKGNFYTQKNVQLWMPARLLKIDNVELNYIAARKGDQLLLAFTNQSGRAVTTKVTVNPGLVKLSRNSNMGSFTDKQKPVLKDSSFTVRVEANGITAIAISAAKTRSSFQDKLLATNAPAVNDYAKLAAGNAHAMLFQLGTYDRRLYVYLQDDDNKYKQVSLTYTLQNGKEQQIVDAAYPFEFTAPVTESAPVTFQLSLVDVNGQVTKSEKLVLGNKTR
jgi:hypothetical protein